MTVQKLHDITAALLANKQGDLPVAIDYATFAEHEDANILEVETAEVNHVQGVDDSGPVGRRHPMLVISGPA